MIKLFPLVGAALLVVAPLRAADPAPATPAAATAKAPQNVTPDQAEKIIKNDPKVVVLDVRTPDEYQSGHIPGAKNIDYLGDNFEQKVAALDQSKTYIVHCAAGSRSAKACTVIEKLEFPSVYHLNSGFKGWEKAGKPVEK